MRYIIGILVLGALFFAIGCDNELDIIEEGGDIPIVYGFLSASDTIQLIRVERAFVDENTSGLVLAQNPDNFFYDENTTVSLVNLDTEESFQLNRIDGNEIGFARDTTGIFASRPNILYSLDSELLNFDEQDEETIFELQIQRPGELPLVTAQSRVVGESSIRRPLENNPSLDFGNFINPVEIRWRKGVNARIYDVMIQFNYQERPILGGDWVNRFVVWRIAQNIEDESTNESQIEITESPENFYNFLASTIPVDDSVVRRAVDADVMVVGGGGGTNATDEVDIVEYIRVEGANLGITATQVVPSVSNLSEGLGIFGSTFTTVLTEVRLTDLTKDSLNNGVITRNLGFQ